MKAAILNIASEKNDTDTSSTGESSRKENEKANKTMNKNTCRLQLEECRLMPATLAFCLGKEVRK